MIELMEQLLAATPPDEDPYLSRLDTATLGFVTAGFSYHKGAVLHDLGRRDEAQRHLDDFVARLPIQVEFNSKSKGSAVVEDAD